MIKIYKDPAANAIFIEDANGVQFINSLQASDSNSKCSIHDLARDIDIVTEEPFTEFIDENGDPYGVNITDVVNALNAIFQSSGTPTGNVPVITSTATLSMVEGSTLNHTLVATYGVGYEWDSLPSGITTVEGNVRKLIGGSTLASGTYTFTAKAINYNGVDTQTLTLTVSTPAFANTKSIEFNSNQWLGANAALLDNTLGRTGNGSGSSDAWSISFWIKPSTNSNNQGIFLFGGVYSSNGAIIDIRYVGTSDSLWIRYGTAFNRLQLQSPNNSLPANTWSHCMVTYNGGTTGAASGSINSYYNRFNMFINGVNQVTTGSNNNFGYTGAISGSVLQVGKSGQNQSLRNVNIDEFNIWDTDESANIVDIYNGGVVFDTMTLTDQPKHRWRMGDGDTYPNLQDSGTAANCTFVMQSMTSANIVNDVP
ncbi:MAG: hypothetical protein CMJ25_15125 [Phycisphaerae bacterium]|nr:hypothetical protein [Phycisphaerae bacterium]